MTTIDRDRIAARAKLIGPYVRVTPVVEVDSAELFRDAVRAQALPARSTSWGVVLRYGHPKRLTADPRTEDVGDAL
jgi:hypothetical protein